MESCWLDAIDWAAIPVDIRPAEKMPRDVLGMYSFGKIVLMESLSAHAIFPTYIHELRHRWQWKTRPIAYLVGKVIRPLIEADAVDAEEDARAFIVARGNSYRDLD